MNFAYRSKVMGDYEESLSLMHSSTVATLLGKNEVILSRITIFTFFIACAAFAGDNMKAFPPPEQGQDCYIILWVTTNDDNGGLEIIDNIH